MSNTQIAVCESEQITAPIRLEGQSNSEVLFNWLTVKRYLWMLTSPYDDRFETIVGSRVRFRLGYKLIEWRRDPNHGEGHEALAVPADDESCRAFNRLEELIKHHFFES